MTPPYTVVSPSTVKLSNSCPDILGAKKKLTFDDNPFKRSLSQTVLNKTKKP